jgi:hypothetical protein
VVADREVKNPLAHCLDHAGALVAEHHRPAAGAEQTVG